MIGLARLLYAAVANLTTAAVAFVPPGSSKAALAMGARRGILRRYRAWAEDNRGDGPLLWMHAPSVGEGLQARPVLQLLRQRHPQTKLAYTFFSPSAEEFSRSLDVDFRDYLPFDAARAMGGALDALRPRAVVFSKLDVWPEFVRQAKRRGVRLGMISATMSAASSRRSGLASLVLRDAYAALDAVGAVDDADADRLVTLGVRKDVITVSGDTRYDQVAQRAAAADRKGPMLSRLAAKRPTLVAGSSWPADEAHLLPAFIAARARVPSARMIIAPHEMSPDHLDAIVSWAAREHLSCARIDEMSAATADVVLVDRFGLLGDLYALADVAFVGGGFHSAGLHSVLEPAAFGAPVLFGPMHERSRDAVLLLAAGGAMAVRDAGEAAMALEAWFGPQARTLSGNKAREFVQSMRGAADRSARLVERLLD